MDPAVAGASASAPPAAFEDGLGERRHTVGAGNEPLEILRLSTELSAVSSFEFALRERASRFATFRHDAYQRVRAVERLDKLATTLVVVSDHVRGIRLSEILESTHKTSLPVDMDAALCLIRQLVSAVAVLHETVPDGCHGALGPERIIITPEGRLVIAEYVLGAALEQLRYSQERYWRELRIALPRTVGLPRFDGLSDVTQMGTVALALILGRPLASHEYPSLMSEIAGHAQGKSVTGVLEPLSSAMRLWLLRALQLDPRASFVSATEAQADLEITLAGHDPAAERTALRAFMSRYASLDSSSAKPAKPITVTIPVQASSVVAPPVTVTPPPVTVTPPPVTVTPPPPLPPSAVAPSISASHQVTHTPVVPAAHSVAEHSSSPLSTSGASSQVSAHSSPIAKPETPKPAADATWVSRKTTTMAHEKATHKREDAHASHRRNPSREAEISMAKTTAWPRPWIIAAAGVLIAITSGVTMLGRLYLFPPAAAEATGTLVVGTNPEGAAVIIDGRHRGATPLSVEGLTPGDHILELVTESEQRRLPVRITAGGQVSQFLELPKTAPTLGDLQIRTEPSRAKITVDGHLFGRSPLVVKNLTPGIHTVVLENETGSFTQDVTIEAGQTAALFAPLAAKSLTSNVSGWISIAAPADVQVYENQRLLGSSRSDRIMVSVGRHELEITNETLGYRTTRAVDVEAGKVSALRLDWPRGTLALNALPWAEVWVDGERVGETPIGSVAVPIGTHEIVFRHPDLGERKSTVNVAVGVPAKVSVDLRAR